jgi:hypothetical protein
LVVILGKSLAQVKEYEALVDSLSDWMNDAEEQYVKLTASAPSTADDAHGRMICCRTFRDDLAQKQRDLDELAAVVQQLRQSGMASSSCLATSNQMNSRYAALMTKVKVVGCLIDLLYNRPPLSMLSTCVEAVLMMDKMLLQCFMSCFTGWFLLCVFN